MYEPDDRAAPLPAGVLKRVLATHPYTAEDEDELSFGASDVFCVLPYEDPEEAGKFNCKYEPNNIINYQFYFNLLFISVRK